MFYFAISVILLTVIYKNMPISSDVYFIGFSLICSALVLHNHVGTYRNKTAEEFDWEEITEKLSKLVDKLDDSEKSED